MANLSQAQKQIIDLIESEIIPIPTAKQPLCALLIKFLMADAEEKPATAKVTIARELSEDARLDAINDWIIKRITVSGRDSMGGWRYKSSIRGQLLRAKIYKDLQSMTGIKGDGLFDMAIKSLADKIEVSGDGKQIRLSRG